MRHIADYIGKVLAELGIDAHVEHEEYLEKNYVLATFRHNEDDEEATEKFIAGAVLGGAPLNLHFEKSYDIDDNGHGISEYVITRK